jgi:F0F1-type ATP synthase alpha subunit
MKRFKIIEGNDKVGFEDDLEVFLKANEVIDIKYSTHEETERNYVGNGNAEYFFYNVYSALIIYDDEPIFNL